MWPRDENQCHVGIGTFYPLEVFQRHNHLFLLMLKTWSLCSGAEVQSWRPSLGEVEKNSFIALPGTEQHSRLMPQNCVSQPRRIEWVSEQWFKGGVADKIRACIPLIWPHWWASRLSHCDFSLEHLPVVGVFILQNSLKMLICAPLQGKPGPCPKAPQLSLHPFPPLMSSPLKGFHAQEPHRVLVGFILTTAQRQQVVYLLSSQSLDTPHAFDLCWRGGNWNSENKRKAFHEWVRTLIDKILFWWPICEMDLLWSLIVLTWFFPRTTPSRQTQAFTWEKWKIKKKKKSPGL